MMTDTISDMLARINNARLANHASVVVPYSIIKEQIVKKFVEGGFLDSFDTVAEGYKKQLVINFKKLQKGESVIRGIKRISKPGKRVYVSVDDIKPFKGGFGMTVISTPKGVVSDSEAKKRNIGGEVLCAIW